jgi:hypothetical protein
MTAVIARFTESLDGYIAEPNDGPGGAETIRQALAGGLKK